MGGGVAYCKLFLVIGVLCSCFAGGLSATQKASLTVDASDGSGRKIPDSMFGVFFEELNHAGAGGLWAELVRNRGFEAGGENTPSNFDPWTIIGNEQYISVLTDRTSCFERNMVALRMEILCDTEGVNICPTGGVGIYNPGYWGMNIVQGETYKVSLHLRSSGSVNLSLSLTSSDGSQNLGTATIIAAVLEMSNWTKVELLITATGSSVNARFQLTTAKRSVIWLDQVSLMPSDTYKGHGFRKDLASMLADLKPRFLRFPGGSFVEGQWLTNAYRWRETVGPWEERPGHFGDIWRYWTDDGLGYYEFLQLAEDLGASPVWVINGGISRNDEIDTSLVFPFVQDILEGIEFARGDLNSKWGSVRAAMGHPEPFYLKYVAIGNQNCGKRNYRGNYLKFYSAIKASYPDVKVITNCDGSSGTLDHPADLYDFHVYTSANNMFSMAHQFDRTSRSGPKVFVSEYAVTGNDAGKGSFLAALAQAGFLIGLERNSDVVEMASNAPLFVNVNDQRFLPDAIFFNSWQLYGTPTYWMQHFFKDSSGSILHPSSIRSSSSRNLIASAITWKNSEDNQSYLKLKIVNFGSDTVNLVISINGLQNGISASGSTKTVLTSRKLTDENSFKEPNKVVPITSLLQRAGQQMNVAIDPHSINSFDLSLLPLAYLSAI